MDEPGVLPEALQVVTRLFAAAVFLTLARRPPVLGRQAAGGQAGRRQADGRVAGGRVSVPARVVQAVTLLLGVASLGEGIWGIWRLLGS